jgi:hypothetical protein
MNRTVMSLAALALVGAGVFAFGQTQKPSEPEAPSPGLSFPGMAGMRSSAEDRAVILDARIVAVKAVLRLTPEQEKLWEPVEAYIRKGAALRAQRLQEMRDFLAEPPSANEPGFDPIARMRKQADRMAERAAFLHDFADAAAPLFASLTGDQKRRALLLFNRTRADLMGMGAKARAAPPGMMGSEIDWPG